MSILAHDARSEALARLLAWIGGIDLPMFVVCQVKGDRLQFVHANAALGRVTGLPTSIFTGQTAAELFPARLAERLERNYRACLSGDAPVSYEECIKIDDRETWWQTTLSKPDGFDGKVILGVAVSTTERKEREFAAAQAVANLSARFDELKLFSTMAAHDARSPLATVSSLIDLVLDGFHDMGDGKAELLRLCGSTVDEALAQITATLERSRNLTGTSSDQSKLDLGRLAGDIAAMVDPEKSLKIVTPQTWALCDEVVVQMGLRNLMSNAARFCAERITVSARAHDNVMQIDVADDGPGLVHGTTLADLTQAGQSRDGVHGFGLRSVAQLLRSRGGTLEVVSGEVVSGEVVSGATDCGALPGACFRMTLPGRIISARGTGAANASEAPPALLSKALG